MTFFTAKLVIPQRKRKKDTGKERKRGREKNRERERRGS